MKNRCVIFDCHHPKHYLVLRQLACRCASNGIRVIWTMRDKDVLVDLVRRDGYDPVVLTRSQRGVVQLFGELVVYDLKLLRLAHRFRPAALMGNSISIAHVGKLLGIPAILINDDDASANPQYPFLGYPFATRIITPECLKENYGRRHRTYPGIHELAYLHPNIFTPDPGIRKTLGVLPDERVFLIRTVALKASHDIGEKGLSVDSVVRIADLLSKQGRVFISSENPLSSALEKYRLPVPPSRMHDILAACDLFIGDSQTMAAEAAVLGTPSIRVNTFVKRISYLEILEHRYRLTFGFTPDREDEMFDMVASLLGIEDLRRKWHLRRDRMLQTLMDPTDVFWDELTAFLQ